MSYFRNKRSRQIETKGSGNQSAQYVVSEVIRNIAATEEQDADNIRSYLNDCDDDSAVVKHSDFWSLERNDGVEEQSEIPPRSRPLLVCALDSQRSRKLPRRSKTLQKRSLQLGISDDQVDKNGAGVAAVAEETAFDSSGELWMDDRSVAEIDKVTDTETSYSRLRKRYGLRREFLPTQTSPPLAIDLQQGRASQTLSVSVQHSDDHANDGVVFGEAERAELGIATATDDLRPSQGNTAEKPSLTPPTNRSFPAVSFDPSNHLQRQPNCVRLNDEEPVQGGLSESQPAKVSKCSKDVEDDEEDVDFDDTEDLESDGEPTQPGLSQAPRLKAPKWGNDIHFDEVEEVELRDSKGKRGKKGGAILPRHVWSLRPGVRIVVPFNSLDQPVRKGGFVLVRFLGDVAKVGELCPIGELNWTKVDKSCKANIIALLREKFVLPDRPLLHKHILKHIGNRWRHYRHSLKTDYKKPGKTQEEVASIVPKGVIPSQWVKLVEYWFSDKYKLYCRNGKLARSAQLHFHTTGSKSFARRRDEFEKTHGREPGAFEWFLKTHQRKDGSFLENTTKEFVDTAAALISERASTSSKERIAVENEVFNELMYSDDEQSHKRPIGYGFGISRSKLFGIEAEFRKRGYGGYKTEGRDNSYLAQESKKEVERLNFAMIAMGESNELMRGQIKMQSQQLQIQSQQLRTQSKQIEGLQMQLERVTSLLTKYGSMNNPRISPMSKGVRFQGVYNANRQVVEASSESGGGESDSTDWYSD